MSRRRSFLIVGLVLLAVSLAGCADQTQSQSVSFPSGTTNDTSYSEHLWGEGRLWMQTEPQPLPKDAGFILAISSEGSHWTALFEKPDGSIKQISTYDNATDAAGMRMLVGVGDYVTVKTCCGNGLVENVSDVKILAKDPTGRGR